MAKEKFQNSYRSLKDGTMSDWHLGDCLNNHLKTGYNIVKIDHDSAVAASLPITLCNENHYIVGHLFVSESGTDDKLQRGRTIGQVLLLNGCNASTTDIYRRLGNCSNGHCQWGAWTQITDKECLDELEERILNSGLSTGDTSAIIGRLQGTSESSDASKDPFKFLGEFYTPNDEGLLAALDGLHSTSKADGNEGVWRFTVQGKPSVLYNFAMNYPQDKWLQGLITIYSPSGKADSPFTINNKMNILYRTLTAGVWSPWTSIVQGQNDAADIAVLESKVPKKRNFVQMDGDDAYIISKYNANYDIVVHFAKTLANELYTMKRIYLAANIGTELSTDYTRPVAVLLASQESSDMIGPLTVRTSGSADGTSWVGGNHFYLNQSSGVRSAKTDSFVIFVDGREITTGGAFADEVTVKVVNTIFDPNVAPESGATILTSPLIRESVSYNVDRGEVLVCVEHKYFKDIYVGIYYGMQSMFTTATQFITAAGGYSNWQNNPTSGVLGITKSTAALLNRFSQKNANGYYQNTVLLPYGLGNHNLVGDSDDVFKWSGSKLYHVLICQQEIANGTVLSWMGVYNWNKPIVDDSYNYIYSYKDKGGEYLSITAKKVYKNVTVTLPEQWHNVSFAILSGGEKATVGELVASNLVLTTTAAGSAIGASADVCITEQKLSATLRSKMETPLRPLYIISGAEYNDSGADKTKVAPWGESVTHLVGHYYLNGLGDITEEQMMEIYNYKDVVFNLECSRIAQNLPVRTFYGAYIKGGSITQAFDKRKLENFYTFFGCEKLEVLLFTSRMSSNGLDSTSLDLLPATGILESTFANCVSLRIIGGINCSGVTSLKNVFNNCTSLVEVRLYKIAVNVSFENSADISKGSINYIIKNATPTSAITITLHPSAYARLANDADIVSALESQTLVSLVSA